MQKERIIQNNILTYFKLKYPKYMFLVFDNKGSYDPVRKVFRANTKHKIKGVADIIAFTPKGKVFMMEVKSEKGILTPDQREFGKSCLDRNIPYAMVRNVKEAETFLLSI